MSIEKNEVENFRNRGVKALFIAQVLRDEVSKQFFNEKNIVLLRQNKRSNIDEMEVTVLYSLTTSSSLDSTKASSDGSDTTEEKAAVRASCSVLDDSLTDTGKVGKTFNIRLDEIKKRERENQKINSITYSLATLIDWCKVLEICRNLSLSAQACLMTIDNIFAYISVLFTTSCSKKLHVN